MTSDSNLLDEKAAEAYLMRFLAIDSVTGHERAIAEAVADALREVGVPGAAIRHDSVHERFLCRPRSAT